MSKGWIGVDLDGTLAFYDEWRGSTHIGAPIPEMVERVKGWRDDHLEVRIFTARVQDDVFEVYETIAAWCLEHLGEILPITNKKDFSMICLYDDRCVQVEKNTGKLLSEEFI